MSGPSDSNHSHIFVKPALKNFTIPLKKQAVTEELGPREFKLINLKPDPSDKQGSELINLMKSSRFNSLPPCKYHSLQIVKNSMLYQNFKLRRNELKEKKVSSNETFAFVLLTGDKSEIEYVCQYGLAVGSNFMGDVGSSEQGVFVSKYSDLVTPAPFFEGLTMKILVVKVLLGRRKEVGLESGEMDADPLYNSHYAPSPPPKKRITTFEMYRYSQLFVYEHDSSLKVVSYPRSILPYAVVAVTAQPSSYRLFRLLNANLKEMAREEKVWSGTVEFGPGVKTECSIVPANRGPKPLFTSGTTLNLSTLVLWKECVHGTNLSPLLTPKYAGQIHRVRELSLDSNRKTVYVSYYTVVGKSKGFEKVVNAMRTEHAASVSRTPEGVELFAIPNGEFSSVLSLPSYRFPVFHLLAFSPHPQVQPPRIEQVEEREIVKSGPPLALRVDADSAYLLKIFAELLKKCKSKKRGATRTTGADDGRFSEVEVKQNLTAKPAERGLNPNDCIIIDEGVYEPEPEPPAPTPPPPCELTPQQRKVVWDLVKVEEFMRPSSETFEDFDENEVHPRTTPALNMDNFVGIGPMMHTPSRPANIYVPQPPPTFYQPPAAPATPKPTGERPFSFTSPSNLCLSESVWDRLTVNNNVDDDENEDVLIIDEHEPDHSSVDASRISAHPFNWDVPSAPREPDEHSDPAASGVHPFPVNIPAGRRSPLIRERPLLTEFPSTADVDLRERITLMPNPDPPGAGPSFSTNHPHFRDDGRDRPGPSRPKKRLGYKDPAPTDTTWRVATASWRPPHDWNQHGNRNQHYPHAAPSRARDGRPPPPKRVELDREHFFYQ